MTENPTKAPSDPNTGAGLIEFLDAAIDKGWFNVSSLKAMKTATLKIFEVESGWADVDLRSLDVDSLIERFRNLRRNAYSDDSIRVYRQRFGQALKMHLARLDGDSNWKSYGPSTRVSAPKPGTNGTKATKVAEAAKTSEVPKVADAPKASPSANVTSEEEEGVPMASTPTPGGTPLMRFPFPLRDNVDVWLTLPRDLTKDEAERLSIFIGSLARRDAPSPANSPQE